MFLHLGIARKTARCTEDIQSAPRAVDSYPWCDHLPFHDGFPPARHVGAFVCVDGDRCRDLLPV